MRRFLVALSFALLAFAAQAAGKTKVLLVTGGHGFEKEAFFKVFDANADRVGGGTMTEMLCSSAIER